MTESTNWKLILPPDIKGNELQRKNKQKTKDKKQKTKDKKQKTKDKRNKILLPDIKGNEVVLAEEGKSLQSVKQSSYNGFFQL